MVKLNGILCSFSAPLNGCPLNGTVIGVRHKFLLFAEMARYLNVWMSFWRTHACQNTHTQNTGQLFFQTESLQVRPWSKSSARELSTSMSSSWLCQGLPIWQWASLQNGDKQQCFLILKDAWKACLETVVICISWWFADYQTHRKLSARVNLPSDPCPLWGSKTFPYSAQRIRQIKTRMETCSTCVEGEVSLLGY